MILLYDLIWVKWIGVDGTPLTNQNKIEKQNQKKKQSWIPNVIISHLLVKRAHYMHGVHNGNNTICICLV